MELIREGTKDGEIGQVHAIEEVPESHQQLGAQSPSRQQNRPIQAFARAAPLNKYLKWIQRVDSSRCPACGADEETIEHFLLL
jgi:hypothetical protein